MSSNGPVRSPGRSLLFHPTGVNGPWQPSFELPDEIGLISLRELAPVIAQLRSRHQLNILSIEAVAAAVYLGATVGLSTRSPRLEAALTAEGRAVEIVE